MIKIIISNKEYEIEPWWNWVAIDDDGFISAFYNEPTFQYWNGYEDGRFWDTKNDYEFRFIDHISEFDLPYGRSYKIERGIR